MSDDPLGALFSSIAESARPAGSASESAVRERCAAWLTQHGYHCVERPFTYSAWPGYYGVAAVGAMLVAAGTIACVGSVMDQVPIALALGFGLAVVAVAFGAILTRYGTTVLPWMRRTGVNLEARRTMHGQGVSGDLGEPALWLVAHLDSKSQTISMRVRVTAIVACVAAWVALAVLWAVRPVTAMPSLVFSLAAAAATLAAIPLASCRTGHAGTGAFDNASGVATILGAVEHLDPSYPVGVLLTSAEELGLAGARAWAAGRMSGLAINCDGVDDRGAIVCMLSGATEYQFRDAFRRAGVMTGEEVIVRPLIPGVLVDAVAFKDAGWRAVTVSRGTWRSLARVHTSADDAARTTGAGIGRTARFVARLCGAMVAEGR